VKATLHWVSAARALDAEVRLYDRLVKSENPGARYQFERLGYFCVDPDTHGTRLVFNRTVGLRDTWAKVRNRGE